ncbi:DUF397 domain-containing protein [Embleya sp. NBC_00896]|uniref:DUF397 domain-containing protein n=1 Tax=Embleya sp. NBC_00896 TaxID=2975961 RepID=UPI0038659477|nr:DUF397 domain-containing protein [Embleya sp. NBC_00896]
MHKHGHSSASWRRSTYSGVNGECVEAHSCAACNVAVRDSKRPAAPVLTFRRGPWHALTSVLGARSR